MTHALHGPAFTDADFEALIVENGDQLTDEEFDISQIDDEGVLCIMVVEEIVTGGVIGWFQE